jgi:site-specific DNA recombinase
MSKRAVIYCRVSTKEQVEEGNSLSTQEKICREYSLKHGYDIADIFVEQGESAKTQNRPELRRMMAYCASKKNNISVAIAYKIDRISRNTDDYSQIRIVLKKYGVEIKSTSENFENNPAGRFMENMMANVAQFDNDVRTERSVGGMRDASRDGRYVWMAPLGYDNVKLAGKATIAPNLMAPFMLRAFQLVAENVLPVEEIRRLLTTEGLVTKSGKAVIRSYFYTLLKNPLYTGQIHKFGEIYQGNFESIVSEELFTQVQRVLRHRTRRNFHYVTENPDFPLRRFVQHSSGLKLTGYWAKGRTKMYPYYRFHIKGHDYRKERIEDAFIAFLDTYGFDEMYYEKLRELVRVKLVNSGENWDKEAKRLEQRMEELNTELRKISQNHSKGIYNDLVMEQQVKMVEKDMLSVGSALAKIPKRAKADYEKALSKIRDLLQNPGKTWAMASYSVKVKLQWLYFPKGVIFDGEKCRTTEKAFVLRIKEILSPYLSVSVHSGFVPSNQIEDEMDGIINNNGLANDIITLAGIIEEQNT